MKRTTNDENMSVFEQIRAGLDESIAQARGELTLRTTRLPAPPPPLGAKRVARIRKRAGMSQAVFAASLNVSKKTVQSWEQGTRIPKAGEARLLQIFLQAPEHFGNIIWGQPGRRAAPRRRRTRAA